MRERLKKLLDMDFGYVDEMPAEKLADHLLANGVIVPPVKVRQKVCLVGYTGTILEKKPCIIEGVVYTITISELNYEPRCVFDCRVEINGEGEWFCFLFSDVGKTVFLTKEEAERALAEMSKE